MFNNFGKKNGVARHQTVAGTSQQNDLVKRFNRVILKRMRWMLLKLEMKTAEEIW